MNPRHALFAVLGALPLILITACATTGSNANEPFLNPPHYVGPPDAAHSATNRAFQGIPSLAVAPGGRLWGIWYAGVTPGEDQNNYVVITTSGDNGATWKEALIIDPDGSGPVRAFDPELWVTPDGRLFAFWAQGQGHIGSVAGVWCIETREPDSAQPKWSKPRRLTDGIMMCKPLVLSSGEWALPASTWRETDQSARMVISADQGRTWSVRGGCNVPVGTREFDEHMFIERRNGSIWLLVRTKYGIGESVSTDRGQTWPELKPSAIAHPSARFFIRRLASGNLLLVKHGPVRERLGRSHLTAFISQDDGRTWSGGLLLDERNGVSYPDGQQTADGLIHVIYDYSRVGDRQILMAAFREEDVAAGQPVSGAVRLRQVVSQASGGLEKPAASSQPVAANADGEPLRRTTPGAFGLGNYTAEAFALGAELFTDRKYKLAELPGALRGARFVKVPLDGAKELTCARAGTVWFLTPVPSRNKDSVTAALLGQGFKKVALPEARLFNPSSPANYCTLYQKDCAAGEAIRFGKWAVPLFFP